MTIKTSTGKIGLVGCGMVGMSFAYSLIQSGLATELVLIDIDHARAEGEALDLNHGMSFVRPVKVYAADYVALSDADIVVVCAGANQNPGETRLDLLKKNLAVFNGLIPQINAVNNDAVILIATNPVDILTYATARHIVGDPRRVLGSGTLLDTARFRYNLGAHYGVDTRSVHAYIVGEHGDSEIPLWSSADIGSVPLRQFIGPNGQGYDEEKLNQLFLRTRDAAYEIIKRKKATYYAIGLSLLAIVEAIMRDHHRVLTVSSLLTNQLGVSDVALSLPTIVGRGGMIKVLDAPMTSAEIDGFRHSANVLKTNWQNINSSQSA